MTDPFTIFSLVLIVTIIVTIAAKVLRQPLIIGYIISGLIVGPYFFDLLSGTNSHLFEIFSEFGIALLLFIVGINMSPKVIREVGKTAFITGIGQIVFTVVIGLGIALLIGFNFLEAIFVAIALTFSSTIIILKLLADKKHLNTLYGKITIGFLLVQDIVATVILIFISAFNRGGTLSEIVVQIYIVGILLTIGLGVFVYKFLPYIVGYVAKSQELLFLFAISYGFGVAVLFEQLGFSLEVGALVAGITLSFFPYSEEISSRMRPLRDFFVIIFFILLGVQVDVAELGNVIRPALMFSLFVLLGNPLIVMVIMGYLGYKRKISFLSGLGVAQISEFSLIVVKAGTDAGYFDRSILSLTTIVGLITIAGSAYMINHAESIYKLLSKWLKVFELRSVHTMSPQIESPEILLIGHGSLGREILNVIRNKKETYAVIDFDPKVIQAVQSHGVKAVYGDMGDFELIEDLDLSKTKLIISTISDFETSRFIIKNLKKLKRSVDIVVTAANTGDAMELYSSGAAYVIVPSFISGRFTHLIFDKSSNIKSVLKLERQKHLSDLTA